MKIVDTQCQQPFLTCARTGYVSPCFDPTKRDLLSRPDVRLLAPLFFKFLLYAFPDVIVMSYAYRWMMYQEMRDSNCDGVILNQEIW